MRRAIPDSCGRPLFSDRKRANEQDSSLRHDVRCFFAKFYRLGPRTDIFLRISAILGCRNSPIRETQVQTPAVARLCFSLAPEAKTFDSTFAFSTGISAWNRVIRPAPVNRSRYACVLVKGWSSPQSNRVDLSSPITVSARFGHPARFGRPRRSPASPELAAWLIERGTDSLN